MEYIRNKKLIEGVAFQLKIIREDRDLSQQQVYNDTNIHIGRIEAGNDNISISTLKAVCNYYQLSLKDLFEKVNA